MKYRVLFVKSAEKDKPLLKAAGLDIKAKKLLNILCDNPYQTPPPFEKLKGNLSEYCSRRINHQHRLVYRVDEAEKVVLVIAM